MAAWRDFRERHEVPDYQAGDNELAYLDALVHALEVGAYSRRAAIRRAFDIGVMRGRIEGVALAQKLIAQPPTKE